MIDIPWLDPFYIAIGITLGTFFFIGRLFYGLLTGKPTGEMCMPKPKSRACAWMEKLIGFCPLG